MVVRSCLAWLVISALLAASGLGSLLHTHDYDDHEHPAHHHGPAVHQHHSMPAHRDEGAPILKECDPGKHSVPFGSVSATIPHGVVALDALDRPELPVPDLRTWRVVGYADVRAHGPPTRSTTPPRAPPPIAHA